MKYLGIVSIIIGIIGFIIDGFASFLVLGVCSYIIGFLILLLFEFRCSNCGKWFSQKKISENYSNSFDSNIFSDNIYATKNITYQCNKCKKITKSSRSITKKIQGHSNSKIEKFINNNK